MSYTSVGLAYRRPLFCCDSFFFYSSPFRVYMQHAGLWQFSHGFVFAFFTPLLLGSTTRRFVKVFTFRLVYIFLHSSPSRVYNPPARALHCTMSIHRRTVVFSARTAFRWSPAVSSLLTEEYGRGRVTPCSLVVLLGLTRLGTKRSQYNKFVKKMGRQP